MRYQRKDKDVVEAFEYTNPMSEELIDALKEKEGMYVFKGNGDRQNLIIHALFKDKKALIGDYIVFMPDGTLDCQSKDIFFSKFEEAGD